MRNATWMIVLALTGCGGRVVVDVDAGHARPPCYATEYGCSFCIPDAAPNVCGNIGRFVDGEVELGCCLDGTPYCVDGECVSTN